MQIKTPKIGLSRLNETIPSSFSSFYLTLIGLIQGVALGLLATRVPTLLSSFSLIALLYVVLTFIVIVIVWHEYVLAAQEFWWKITWLDSLAPFLLGMGEFLMIEYLDRGPNYSAWFFAAAFTGFGGFLAYINYDLWLNEQDFENSEAYAFFKAHVRKGRFLFLSLTLLNSACGVVLLISFGRLQLLLLGALFAVSLFFMIHKRSRWHIHALKIYGWQK